MGTRTQREIEAVLDRGGVIGGSSAGATIQGSYLVRGAREGNHIMMAKGYEQGFGYLRGVAIDQHLIVRGREDDLVEVIDKKPELLGLGLDEPAAVIVQGDRLEVIGRSVVGIYDGKDHDGKKYFFLAPGDQFDLRLRSASTTKTPGNGIAVARTRPEAGAPGENVKAAIDAYVQAQTDVGLGDGEEDLELGGAWLSGKAVGGAPGRQDGGGRVCGEARCGGNSHVVYRQRRLGEAGDRDPG